jgi:hypothetical protein
MPGKSKKGGGLESSPVYKKQAYGTAKSPFMMKGVSPLKQEPHKTEAISTYVAPPIVPTVTEESSKEIPPGFFSGTGFKAEFTKLKKKKKKNILTSFTDFLKSKK